MNVSAMRWLLLLGLLALAAAAADEDDEYEEAPAYVKPQRPSPLLRQARGPVIGRPAPKSAVSQKSTTTTTEAPVEYDDEEELGVEEEVTTTTEAQKRTGVRTGVVRPFRSNMDLLDALKRRRQQKNTAPISTTNTAPAQPTERAPKASRRLNPESDQTGSTSENKTTHKFKGRSKSAPTTEPPEEPAPKTRSFLGRNLRNF